jgi:hypothetical protein
MSKPPELSIEMLVAQAKAHLALSDEALDRLRPIFATQVQSINRLRGIHVDIPVEPDIVFDPEPRHD